MILAISFISLSSMPSVVTAGVPIRRPLVYHGPFGSNGTALRFSVNPHARSADSPWRLGGRRVSAEEGRGTDRR
jgi:hypothetical protein